MVEQEKSQKRTVVFNDKEKQKVKLKIELKEGRFSISGDCGGSFGQCYDSIKPTPTQKKIIAIWKKYHLNDMNAGTPEQEKALKGFKGDYDAQCEHLKKKGLYEVTLKNGKPYKYGTGWITRELPTDLWAEVEAVCNKIEAEQQAYKEKMKGGSWEDLDDKIRALGLFLDMSPKEAEETIEISDYSSTLFEAEGISYYVGSEDEIHEEAITYLTEDPYIYEGWVKHQIKSGNASGVMNIDDWAEMAISSDGYGHILNGYDGTEHYDDLLKLYVIRT